ncbi:histidine phosphatase family protein [Marinobacter sp. M216]|uniref:Histidine phosphatase family protein n=1 Tax=Marinobacter albus TaxID=3030833 RepID=A0ABT7HFC3_9GAMM|nr:MULTISPECIES: histidine phosphatase family protein [unclassified Marinobacter]MBW7472022.1 histidine phosphatase family protein [Marinobacter sp. F4218]MDK9558592.1 histidine phosphatase family protein [Marinobacter sp. M216]
MTRDSQQPTADTSFLDLIRHGEPEGGPMFRGSQDDPLSETGWKQMRAAISDSDCWDAVLTSPLQRCRQFAEEVADTRNLPLFVEPDLREVSFGAWEGRTSQQILTEYGDQLSAFWDDPTAITPPEGEPIDAFYRRVTRAGALWQRRLAGQRILVVCHGGVIRMLLADVLHIPLSRSFAGFAVPYACRSLIRFDRSEHGLLRSLLRHGG